MLGRCDVAFSLFLSIISWMIKSPPQSQIPTYIPCTATQATRLVHTCVSVWWGGDKLSRPWKKSGLKLRARCCWGREVFWLRSCQASCSMQHSDCRTDAAVKRETSFVTCLPSLKSDNFRHALLFVKNSILRRSCESSKLAFNSSLTSALCWLFVYTFCAVTKVNSREHLDTESEICLVSGHRG